MLILNDQSQGIFGTQRTVQYHEMVAFRGLLAHTELLCSDGLRARLLGPGSMPLWHQLLGEDPDLLAELQKFPRIPPDQLAKQNPLRFALTKIFGGTFPASFFTIKARPRIVSPFGVVVDVQKKKIGSILQPASDKAIGSELERELAKANLRITNIHNKHEEGDQKELDELKGKLKERVAEIHHLLNIQNSSNPQGRIWTEQDQLDDEAAVRLAAQQAAQTLSARKRERGVEISLDGLKWLPGVKKRQFTSLDVSQCTIPLGCTYSLTCKAPTDTVPRILIEQQLFNAE